VIDAEELLASYGEDDPARFIAIADHYLQLVGLGSAMDRRPRDRRPRRDVVSRAVVESRPSRHERYRAWTS